MMNQRPGVTARVASGDTLRYLDAMGAEGSHMLMEGGRSEILLRPGASRWGAFHEWMHRSLQLRTGGPMAGEDAFIESFLARHQSLLRIQKPVGAP
jgi:hypothetical protein